MKNKPTNPYVMLLNEIKAWIRKLKYRHTARMFFWTVENLAADKVWRLDGLYQRVIAAKELGYEVVVEADEKGMTTKYRKIIETPFQLE